MTSALGLIFAIEIDGKPTIAFEAKNFREASELCKEDWLRTDLGDLKSNGAPLCSPTAKLRVRRADEMEMQIYRASHREVEASDDLVLAYLVELDRPSHPD